MSDKFSPKNNIRAQGRALANQTAELKEQIQQLASGADKVLSHQERRIAALEETVLALVETVGMDEIQASIAATRKRNGEKQVADQLAQLETAVSDGYVLPIEAVDETSYIVGVELDKDGNLLSYGAQQCPFPQLPEEFKPLLLGKKVGDVVTTPIGGKFELTGVYRLDEEKRAEVLKTKADAAAAAAAQVDAPAVTTEQSAQ